MSPIIALHSFNSPCILVIFCSSAPRKWLNPADLDSGIWPTTSTRPLWPWNTRMRPEDFQCTPFTTCSLTLARLCTLPWASSNAWHATVCADAPFLLTEEGSSETHTLTLPSVYSRIGHNSMQQAGEYNTSNEYSTLKHIIKKRQIWIFKTRTCIVVFMLATQFISTT